MNNWAKSNQSAGELLKRGLPKDQELLRQLHVTMAENYSRLGQRANAVESYRKARAITDSPYLHAQMINEWYHGAAKAAELEAARQRIPSEVSRPAGPVLSAGLRGPACLRDGDKPKALAIIAELLPNDAGQPQPRADLRAAERRGAGPVGRTASRHC